MLRYVALRDHCIAWTAAYIHTNQYIPLKPRYTITIHYRSLNAIANHYAAIYHMTLPYIRFHCIAFRYIASHHITWHYTALRYMTLHCIDCTCIWKWTTCRKPKPICQRTCAVRKPSLNISFFWFFWHLFLFTFLSEPRWRHSPAAALT